MSELSYWLDKIGITGILSGPLEAATRMKISRGYTNAEQVDESLAIATAGLVSWNAAKYIEEGKNEIKRSPLVHIGRILEVVGPLKTEVDLQMGHIDDPLSTIYPAAVGVTLGPILEYVVGPIHERFSKRYGPQTKKES